MGNNHSVRSAFAVTGAAVCAALLLLLTACGAPDADGSGDSRSSTAIQGTTAGETQSTTAPVSAESATSPTQPTKTVRRTDTDSRSDRTTVSASATDTTTTAPDTAATTSAASTTTSAANTTTAPTREYGPWVRP